MSGGADRRHPCTTHAKATEALGRGGRAAAVARWLGTFRPSKFGGDGDLVAPKVERSLLIHKDALTGLPTVLDFTKEFAPEHEDAVAAEGAAREAARSLRA
jgi:hypothetical protein